MNKLILVLFGIVLVSTLGIGVFYFFQTQSLSQFSVSTLFSSSVPMEKAKEKAAQNCKNSGISLIKNAESYLVDLIKRIGYGTTKEGTLQVVDIGNNCWGIWIGNEKGVGILYWEDSQGKIYQTKATAEI